MSTESRNPRLRFQAKVLLPVIAIVIALVATTMAIVNHRITRQLESDAANTLLTSDAVFQNSQKIRTRNLVLRYSNVPNEPRFKAVSQLAESRTMRFLLNELIAEHNTDAILFTTAAGTRLAGVTRDPFLSLAELEAGTTAATQVALEGQFGVDTVPVSNRLFEIVAIPVVIGDDILGALTFASELGDAVAHEFNQLTHCEILFIARGRVTASTLRGLESRDRLPAAFTRGDGASLQGRIEKLALANEHFLCLPGRLNSLSNDRELGYLLLSSYEQPLAALRSTQQSLFLAGLLGVALSSAVGWLVIRKITQPLRRLRDGALAVGQGDLSHRVEVHSRDECGELADAFNQMTQNIKASREELENTIEKLATTKAQLTQSEKLSAIGEFVAGVTHELNNPLTSVIGFAQLLQKTEGKDLDRSHLERIVRESQRCHKIVQSLLSFARQHKPERKLVDLNERIDAALDILRYHLRTSNIEVRLHLRPELPKVMADPHQLQQVFVNILNNARQAIESARPNGWVSITTEKAGDHARAVFQDNGPGISEENLAKLFTPFFTTKPVGQGTGLGLSLCYGIIKEHGGTISAHSTAGQGARFSIELPAAPQNEPAAAATGTTQSSPTAPAAGQGKRVLVVDDEDAIRDLIREVLTADNYEVHTAADGESALHLLRRNRYDLTVCDFRMPGLNGEQVYERLRESDPDAASRLIFLTGDVASGKVQEQFRANGKLCLPKPFSVDEFRATVGRVIGTSRN